MTDILLMPHVIEDMSCSVRIQLRLSAPQDDRSPSPVQATLPRLRESSGSNDSFDDGDEVEVEDEDFEDEEEEDSPPEPANSMRNKARCPANRAGTGRRQPTPAKASTSSDDFEPAAEDEDLPPPQKKISNAETNLLKLKDLQKLQRICTIGTGTFGRVFLCREVDSKKYRALKAMPIGEVVKTKQVDHVFSEKRILETLDHPFIIKLHWACHDDHHLYMLFDYIPGGELFSYLRAMGYFTAAVGRFYAVEIILALEYLHKKSTVYRDLKPENLLLNRDGHLKITDFGFAKKLEDRDDSRTWTLCGTPEYLAPELIENRGHNKAVDWWALGVLVFEMLAGYPPFYGNNPMEIYERVLAGKMKFPKYFDLVAKDLVRKMLNLDRTKRLGNMKGGADDVKKHKWFRSISWTDAVNKKLKPPIIPKVTHDGDPGNFDEYEEEDWDGISNALAEEIEVFEDW